MSKPKQRGRAAARRRQIKGKVKPKALGMVCKVEPTKKHIVELNGSEVSPRPGA